MRWEQLLLLLPRPQVLELNGGTVWAIAATTAELELDERALLLHPMLQFSGLHGRAAMVEQRAA
jgi:hypothetical protein